MKKRNVLSHIVILLVLQLSVQLIEAQLNCTACWDAKWINSLKKDDETWQLISRKKNITCYGGRSLFPFGPECADFELSKDHTRSEKIDLGYRLKFMGHRFDKAWINQHGFISFQESFLGQTLAKNDWPQVMYPYADDPVFVAPFYAETDLIGDKTEDLTDTTHGRVLYKVIIRKDLPLYYTEEERFIYQMTMKILDDTQKQIRESVPGGEEFVAMYALIATWKSVSFMGNSLYDIDMRPRNTFQAMIISDEYHSYVVFNYEKIEWYASPSVNGNPETGTGGKAAKIGFNRGNGTLWQGHRPFSENAQLMFKLSNHSNVDMPGRFIFRVDEWIQPAGCIDIDFEHEKKLELWPRNGNMLGGQEVNITGPCFHESPYFLCKWGDGLDAIINMGETTFLNNVNHSEIRARCIQPTIYYNGRVNLSISLDGGKTYDWKTEYNIVDPLRYPPKVELVNVREWHESSTPARLLIRWNRFDLSYAESDLVDIELWGYYEDDSGPHWDFLQLIAKKKLNKGSFGFDVAPNRAPNETMARKYKLGAIAVSLFDYQYESYKADYKMAKRLFSAIHPLGWWRNDEMKFYYDKHSFLFGNSRGRNWAEDQCKWWHEYRRFEDRAWMDELEICPPTVFFAIGDAGTWAPDPNCNMYGLEYNELNCLQHQEASHCVITVQRTESGAGNRCCYDKNGNLMYTNDTIWGSTPDRVHSFGIPPYNTYGKVPGLSHYFHDIVPYYLCCHWSRMCDSYLYLRQTKDAKGYKEPRIAVAYGDPHLMTFDGKDYTFNGKGEFTLFKTKKFNFRLQARFEQPPNATFCLLSSKGQINATRITAIAAGQEDSDIVEVRTRIHPSQTFNFRCDVLVNGKVYYFNFTEEKVQFFRNVYVISPLHDVYQSNITIMFNTSGIGVNVECMHGLMHVRAAAPPSVFKDTQGLFGYWDNITANDFTSPDGSSNQLTLKPDLLYQRFGMAWKIKDESESIFTYSGSWSYDTFHDQRPFIKEWQRYRPWFTQSEVPFPSNVSFTKEEWEKLCEGDEQCLFDAAALGSLEIGEKTRDAHRYYRLLHENMKSVNSCGIYLLKGGIRTLSKGNYLTGSVMKLSCQRGYTLFGYNEFYCNWNGTWLPTNGQWIDRFRDWPYCEHYHITAIRWTSIGISILWVVCLAIGFIFTVFIKKEKQYTIDERSDSQEEDHNIPFNDPGDEDQYKPLENNYFKDGFVPTVKAISHLTKSMNSLNQSQASNKADEESLLNVMNASDTRPSENVQKPANIFQIPTRDQDNENNHIYQNDLQVPTFRTNNPNQSFENSTPIQSMSPSVVGNFNRLPSNNNNNNDFSNRDNNQINEQAYDQDGYLRSIQRPFVNENSPNNSEYVNTMDNRNGQRASILSQPSPQYLNQAQTTLNPTLTRMQRLKEQQQRNLQLQLENQNQSAKRNFDIDSDV